MVAAAVSGIPVINAGDGGHQHPTQTLTDLMTIRSLKVRLDHITIGLGGDLKFGRTVHSLVKALVRYEDVNFVFISPEELRIPSYIREEVLDANGQNYKEVERLEDVIGELDLLYMTRVQQAVSKRQIFIRSFLPIFSLRAFLMMATVQYSLSRFSYL